MATVSITKVEPREYLFIDRIKRKLNQTQYASRMGCTRHQYSEIELGLRLPWFWVEKLILTEVEKCILLRRREGLKQGQLANIIGITRTWVRLMETGGRNPARLIEYWSS